jgi:predicted nucleotidyltransferase
MAAPDLQMVYDQETRKVVEILKQADPARIIRFGSAAQAQLHPESDLDLCVVMDDGHDLPPFRLAQRLYRLLSSNGYRHVVPVELHVFHRRTFEDWLTRDDPFIQEIVKGEVVYER